VCDVQLLRDLSKDIGSWSLGMASEEFLCGSQPRKDCQLDCKDAGDFPEFVLISDDLLAMSCPREGLPLDRDPGRQ
jgi:hypothetical protein